MTNKIRIAVLITCHNRKNLTLNCLKSLYRCKLPHNHSMDVILVDDGSTDGTSSSVEYDFPSVTIIQGDGSLYWNQGMRKAWDIAKKKDYDFYLWVNDDTELFTDAIETILKASMLKNNVAIICGATFSPDRYTRITYGGRTKKGNLIIPNGDIQNCFWFNGNFVLISKAIFLKLGNLDSNFRHSLGDVDYGLRANREGIECILAPTYIGTCSEHLEIPIWKNEKWSTSNRIKYLYSPLGCHPVEFFIFSKRHYGLLRAIIHFTNLHLYALFPKLHTLLKF